MSEKQPNQSEVAELLQQIEEAYLAAQRGLTGFAAGANHTAINARMEKLHAIAGEDAIKLIAERLESIPLPDQ